MKNIVQIFLALIFIGVLTFAFYCVIDENSNKIDVTKKITNLKIDNYPIYIYLIDSCEYIGNINSKNGYLTHKGNCKYCAQRKSKKQ